MNMALESLGIEAEGINETLLSEIRDICADALKHHRALFREAAKQDTDDEIIDHLSKGTFAFGTRSDINLWQDVVLLWLVAGGHEGAVMAFRERFSNRVDGWLRRFARGDDYHVDDFLTDLLIPREKAGPRIQCYRGRGPADGWLKQVYMSICQKRRGAARKTQPAYRQSGEDERVLGDAIENDPTGALPAEDEFMRSECREKLKPLIAASMNELDANHRDVLLRSVVDGTQQKKLATLYGVPAYKITRMKQSALKEIHERFLQLASDSSSTVEAGIRHCIDLLLNR